MLCGDGSGTALTSNSKSDDRNVVHFASSGATRVLNCRFQIRTTAGYLGHHDRVPCGVGIGIKLMYTAQYGCIERRIPLILVIRISEVIRSQTCAIHHCLRAEFSDQSSAAVEANDVIAISC